jgi:hypothetical protein
MKKSTKLLGLLIVVFCVTALFALWANANSQQALQVRQFPFKKVQGINIDVLRKDVFDQIFAANPEVPKTGPEVIQLARRLYSASGRLQIQEECGEHVYGSLFAALANPDIADATRDEVDNAVDADTPPLPKTHTCGHFKFYYTTNNANPDHNVTLAEIQATCTVLNNAWNDYAANFKEPKHYVSGGQKLIDVKVYYLGSSLYGATSSNWNYIELNSKAVVKNACRRQTTPVHELFHRVQYAYGYLTGTPNMKWAVEATASWSQKYRASNVGDWMGRMNSGLQSPDVALVTGRSYDACHFWIYLGRRGNGEKQCVKLAWQTYQTNGKNMPNAVETVVKTRIGAAFTRNWFVEQWNNANFMKDLTNATAMQDYQEDEWTRTCGGVTYGPLAEVPRINVALNAGSNDTKNGSVSAYGADYYVYNLGPTVKKVEINFTATVNGFAYTVILIKGSNWTGMFRSLAGAKNYNFTRTFAPGDITKIAVVAGGNPNGGNYTIKAKASSSPTD